MSLLLTGLILVPLFDQGLKLLLLEWLGPRSISLGAIGRLEIVRTRVWLVRLSRRTPPLVWWAAWSIAAGALGMAAMLMPATGAGAGLLLGGSLSHLLESNRRGWICDFVHVRFWPAFNLADVAICAGALSLAVEAGRLLARAFG